MAAYFAIWRSLTWPLPAWWGTAGNLLPAPWLVIGAGCLWAMIRAHRRLMWRRTHGEEIRFRCGYRTDGCEDSTPDCPECGLNRAESTEAWLRFVKR